LQPGKAASTKANSNSHRKRSIEASLHGG
jgi:hypothetical protein